MSTEVFNSYVDFLARKDKSINGVSVDYAKQHSNYVIDNKTNEGCWNCSSCSYCRNCSGCSYCRNCSYCGDCSYCRNCRNCSDCSDCRNCSDCSYCRNCRNCSDKKGSKSNKVLIPKIDKIHTKVFNAAKEEGALDMSDWHVCETAHCRAGWVVHLAGREGKKLEDFHNTCLAAQLIYRESGYEINPCRFFDGEESAMKDMKRLYELEAKK